MSIEDFHLYLTKKGISIEQGNQFLHKLDQKVFLNPKNPECSTVEKWTVQFVKEVLELLEDFVPNHGIAILKSGSFYSSTRVGPPYEFDFGLVVPNLHINSISNIYLDEFEIEFDNEFSSDDALFVGYFLHEHIVECICQLQDKYNILYGPKEANMDKNVAVTVLLKYNDNIEVSVDLVPCIKFPPKFADKLPPFKDEICELLENVFIKQMIPKNKTSERSNIVNLDDSQFEGKVEQNQTVQQMDMEADEIQNSSQYAQRSENSAIETNEQIIEGKPVEVENIVLVYDATIHTDNAENKNKQSYNQTKMEENKEEGTLENLNEIVPFTDIDANTYMRYMFQLPKVIRNDSMFSTLRDKPGFTDFIFDKLYFVNKGAYKFRLSVSILEDYILGEMDEDTKAAFRIIKYLIQVYMSSNIWPNQDMQSPRAASVSNCYSSHMLKMLIFNSAVKDLVADNIEMEAKDLLHYVYLFMGTLYRNTNEAIEYNVYTKLFKTEEKFHQNFNYTELEGTGFQEFYLLYEKAILETIVDFLDKVIRTYDLEGIAFVPNLDNDILCRCCISKMQGRSIVYSIGLMAYKHIEFDWNVNAPWVLREMATLETCYMHKYIGGCALNHCESCRVLVYECD